MPDSFDDIACSGFAFGADHGGTFGYTAQSFTKVAAAADEGGAERVLFDVVGGVGRGEDFRFVNVVYAEGFEDLGETVGLVIGFGVCDSWKE